MAEILAPAGNLNTFYVAVNNGANAVYLGLKDFSARKSAENFSYDELKTALDYARVMGVKIYVALNTLIKESELNTFFKTVIKLREMGVDAIILQDIFLGKFIHEKLPDIELHLSTQGGVNNIYGAEIAKEFGFKRVILARETPIQEIKKIASLMDTEVFVQGALCTSFSGHCYMSGFAGGNSGNRGLCKQPCRQKYSLNGQDENYPICTADLSIGEKILELQKAGVSSFKIEGRMRRPEYVGAAIRYYRSFLYPHEKMGDELSALKRTYNRGNYTLGLAFGQTNSFLSTDVQGHIGERVGTISKIVGNKILVKGSLNPAKGDSFKVLRQGKEVGSAEYIGDPINSLTPLAYKGKVMVGDEVNITTDNRLNKELSSAVGVRIIDVDFCAKENDFASVKVYADGELVALSQTEVILPVATGNPLDENEVRKVFDKVDNYPFAVDNYNITIEGKPFGAKSVLNALRRDAYKKAYDKLAERDIPWPALIHYEKESAPYRPNSLAVIAEDFSNLNGYHIAIFAPSDYNDTRYFEKFFRDTPIADDRYLYIPSMLSTKDIEILAGCVKDFDGIYGENPHAIALARLWGKKLFLGMDTNIFNSLSLSIAGSVADEVAFSKELSLKEIKETGASGFGYIFTRGDIKVMELGYCLYGKKCNGCKVKTLSTLKDYAGREFTLRRIKLSKCYFEVYNPYELIYEDPHRGIYNLVLHKGKDVVDRYDASEKEYRTIAKTTSGHLKNPIE
ncbi:MAG: U32 family peptidase [Clostridia bacterium]|nr:U32 family peptidase [Clostridia bacterium]